MIGGAIDVLVGRRVPPAGAVVAKMPDAVQRPMVHPVLLRYNAVGEEVPALVLQPKTWNKRAVVWVSPQGKQSLFNAETRSKLRAPIDRLLEAGMAVVGIDLFGQGEFTPDGKPMAPIA